MKKRGKEERKKKETKLKESGTQGRRKAVS
jgi:hypothetical protein